MAKPVLSSFAQELYDRLAPMQFAEATYDYPLAKLLAGIGEMFQVVDTYGRDQRSVPGWATLMDAYLAPSEALGWLAQFVGVTLQVGLSDADQRAWIKSTTGWKRGTVDSLRGAVSADLTGTKTFAFRERYDPGNPAVDSPGHLQVITYDAETPDPTKVLADLMAQKPAGIILHYETLTGQDYQSVKTNNVDYNAVNTKYANYTDMRMDLET